MPTLQRQTTHDAIARPLPSFPAHRFGPPISHHGKVNEIVGKFGADQLRNAVNQLQTLLYAA